MPTLALIVPALALAALSAGDPLPCARASAPPQIDGELDDACWQQAAIATDFGVLGSAGAERAVRQTTARAAWDDRALYWHITCLEPDPDSVTAQVTERDGSVWLEDAVELFLQPKPPAGPWHHIIVNARGTWYDAIGDEASWNADLTLRLARGEEAWSVELALPWEAFGGPAEPGTEWGCNIAREHRPHEPREWSTWAALAENQQKFGLPELFGRLKFVAGPGEGGRISHLSIPEALAKDAAFAETGPDGKLAQWHLRAGSTRREIAPGSGHYAVGSDREYAVISQQLDLPVKAGEVFTVWAMIRGDVDTAAGIAVIQEMQDGRPDDLYPFWKMPVTGKFAMYHGTIVTDKGVKRLKAIALYRANRKGAIEYAYVQMRPGRHGITGLVDTRRFLRREERGTGDPWPTPHLPGYRPLPGGPLRALAFIGEFQRDAAELAQRLDLDYDLVYCPSFRGSGKVECCFSDDPERVMTRLAQGWYEAILLAGRPSAAELVREVAAAVERGCGLVYVAPVTAGRPVDEARWKQLAEILPEAQTPPAEHAVTTSLPLADLATTDGNPMLSAFGVGEHGKGRTVALTWGQAARGLVPDGKPECEYWEYAQAVVARALLWAARREPPARVTRLEVGDSVRATIEASRALRAEVELGWDHKWRGLAPASVQRTVALEAGDSEVAFAVPEAVRALRGLWVARLQLRDERARALDFAAAAAPSSGEAELTTLETPAEVRPDEAFSVRATLRGEEGTEGQLKVSAFDAFGREVARARRSVSMTAAEQTVELPLTLRDPLSVYHRVVATLTAGEPPLVHDRAEVQVLCPAASADALDDFQLAAGYAATSVLAPAHLKPWAVRFLREQGVRAGTVDPAIVREGLVGWGGTVAGTPMSYKGADTARTPCFCNPAKVEELAQKTVERVAGLRQWGWLGYNMHDEVHLHQHGGVEVCTCDFCRDGFRQWAREQYGDIAAANASWGTKHRDFDEIAPPLLKDIKGSDNPARWVDFRMFEERIWANAYAATHDAVRARFLDVRMSFTNPYHYDSMSGVDFSLWLPREEILLRYFKPHVVDQCRSWSDAPMVSWFGYRLDATQSGHFPWWFAFQGGVMPIWWNPLDPWAYSTKESFTPWYLFDPLWRPTGRSERVMAAARELQGGIGALLRAAPRDAGSVGVLYSQASMHVAYAQAAVPLGRPTDAGWRQWMAARDTMVGLLRERGLAYETLNAATATADDLARCSVILLPSVHALSDDLVESLAGFVQAGGRLLADDWPATHTEHGSPIERPQWRAVFDGEGAFCLGERATKENVERLAVALDRWELPAAVRWEAANGGPVLEGELFTWADHQYIGAVREASSEAALLDREPPARIVLPERRHLYDVRGRQYLGRRATVEVDLRPGEACFLAALPERAADLSVRAESGSLGEAIPISFRLRRPGARGVGIAHLEVIGPDDEPRPWYARSVRTSDGRGRFTFRPALNDPPGKWRVEARDVGSGLSATATFEVRP